MLRICEAGISQHGARLSREKIICQDDVIVRKGRPTVNTPVIEGPALNASDRCDRCGAQAYVRVTLANGFDLLFCSHHGKEHADKLKQVALKIHDESKGIG
jgi:hypothetical protein